MADEKCVRDPRHDCFGLEAAARLEGLAGLAASAKTVFDTEDPKGE